MSIGEQDPEKSSLRVTHFGSAKEVKECVSRY